MAPATSFEKSMDEVHVADRHDDPTMSATIRSLLVDGPLKRVLLWSVSLQPPQTSAGAVSWETVRS